MDSGYRSMFTSFEDVVNRRLLINGPSPTAAAPKYFGAAVVRIELVFQIAVILGRDRVLPLRWY